MPEHYELIITCEHGDNDVPARYAGLFSEEERLLRSHRSYDLGAMELAKILARGFGCNLFYSNITRLLIDMNRSPENPRRFSELTRGFGAEEKERIDKLYYSPYRDAVQEAAAELISSGRRVLHVSVHSFAPSLKGKERKADIGLLYDPKRKREVEFCARWLSSLVSTDGSLKVRRNYPYRGVSDGHTAYLRNKFGGNDYVGIELEVNQKHPRGDRAGWLKLMRSIKSSLNAVLRTA